VRIAYAIGPTISRKDVRSFRCSLQYSQSSEKLPQYTACDLANDAVNGAKTKAPFSLNATAGWGTDTPIRSASGEARVVETVRIFHSTYFVDIKNTTIFVPDKETKMKIRFDKEYLRELYETGKTGEKKYRFQPQVIAKYQKK
jgi:hypothetical protein